MIPRIKYRSTVKFCPSNREATAFYLQLQVPKPPAKPPSPPSLPRLEVAADVFAIVYKGEVFSPCRESTAPSKMVSSPPLSLPSRLEAQVLSAQTRAFDLALPWSPSKRPEGIQVGQGRLFLPIYMGHATWICEIVHNMAFYSHALFVIREELLKRCNDGQSIRFLGQIKARFISREHQAAQ